MALLLSLFLPLLAPEAQAFCGYYVGGAGSTLQNSASQVVVARMGRRTTLTLAQDVTTNTENFALVVPVPAVMGPDDVREINPSSLRTIDLYSSPRLVSYPCGDYYAKVLPPPLPGVMGVVGCSADAAYQAADSGAGSEGEMLEEAVTVAASYQTGAYDIQVLDAEDAGDLLVWLDENGYEIAAEAKDLIQSYLDGGSYFFVAKVRLDRPGTAWLPPLQFSYVSSAFSLPIRLGALNGAEEQEMIVYAITPDSEGTVGIANYREVDIESECLFEPGEAFAEFYEEQLRDAFDGKSGWLREYAWSGGKCDPCTGPTLDPSTVAELGYPRSDYAVTRLRMRYAPSAIGEDVSFYTQGYASPTQMRYVVYDDGLTPYYPVCDEGMRVVEGAEDCFGYDDYSGCDGCCPAGLAVVGIVPIAAMLRRRRR